MLHAKVTIVILGLVDKKKPGGHRKKEDADTCVKMEETLTMYIIGGVTDLVEH